MKQVNRKVLEVMTKIVRYDVKEVILGTTLWRDIPSA